MIYYEKHVTELGHNYLGFLKYVSPIAEYDVNEFKKLNVHGYSESICIYPLQDESFYILEFYPFLRQRTINKECKIISSSSSARIKKNVRLNAFFCVRRCFFLREKTLI